MNNITKKYLPYLLMLGVAISLVMAGVTTSASGATSPQPVQAEILPGFDEAPSSVQVAPPASRETTPALQSPSDPAAIVLSGEMGNGGLWSWEDIGNLLGVYSSYGAYVQVTVDGQTLNGVPLSFLLHYARLNAYAATIVFTNRGEDHFSFSAASLSNCAACVVAQAEDHSLTLVMPGFEPASISRVMRLEAYDNAPAVLTVQDMPANPQTINLKGAFARGGEWTWEQIVNLLGVYSTYEAYVNAYAEDQSYAGVPLSYLFDYAGLDANANAIVIYDRAGDVTSAAATALQASCDNCIIAPVSDGTVALVMPGHTPEVIAQLAVIEVR